MTPTFLHQIHLTTTIMNILKKIHVATLALGSWPRQGVVRLQAKKEVQESCRMLSGVQESVRE